MNKDKHYISDEELNAFLDEQLDADERDHVLEAINSDSHVNQRLNELRLLHDMVQHAYEEPPYRNEMKGKISSKTGSRWAVAASFVLTLGVLLGWFGHQGIVGEEKLVTASIQAPEKLNNVILHLTSSDPEKISSALDKAENMLAAYKAQNKDLRLEVIANDGGLNLMRQGVSSFQPRIQQLKNNYANVEFLACARAIQRLQENGVDVELLPEVKVAPSALRQIIQRMQEDWHYIKA